MAVRRVGYAIVAGMFFLAALIVVAIIVQQMTAQPPMVPAPTIVATSTPSMATGSPTQSSRPVSTPTLRPTELSSDTPVTEEPEPTFIDPVGQPIHIRVLCDDEILIDSKLQASPARAGEDFNPPVGMAEWWSDGGAWPRPGVAAEQAGIIGGHVRYGQDPDVFANLKRVHRGCIAEVYYDSGDVVKFEVVCDPESIDKDLTYNAPRYAHHWVPTEPGIWLGLITCDRESIPLPDGSASRNTIVCAIRIE